MSSIEDKVRSQMVIEGAGEGEGDDRPVRYIEMCDVDGELVETVVYRASGFNSCDRLIVAASQHTKAGEPVYPPAPHPEWFQAVLDEGTAAESAIREAWEAKTGVSVHSIQAEFELELGIICGRRVIVRAHTDGLATDLNGTKLQEFKKFRNSTWGNFLRNRVEVHENYPWQVAAMMHATGFECEFVGGHYDDDADSPTYGQIVEVEGWHITDPPIPLKAFRKRAKLLEMTIEAGFDAKEVKCSGKTYPCPQFRIHDVKDEESEGYVLPTEGEEAELLAKFFTDHKAAAEAEREAKAAKKRAADGIDGVLALLGPDAVAAKRLIGEGYVVNHVRRHVKEHTVAASDQEFYQVKDRED